MPARAASNPRNIYPLPNGDLLVVDSKKDAKEPLALCGADTDASLRYPFKVGDDKVGGQAALVDLPAGPISHHWTKSLTASVEPRRHP